MAMSFRPFVKRAFNKELVDFFKHLALMVQSGIPLNEAMSVLMTQRIRPVFRRFLIDIRSQLEGGTPLSMAMEPYRRYVGDLAMNIVRAGEVNGTLEVNLKYLADILARNRDLKQRVSSAFLYPEIVLAMAFSIGGGISIVILPKLIPLFVSLNVKLPLATRIMLAISLFLRDHGVLAMGGLAGGVVLMLFLRHLSPVKWVLHWIEIHLPFFGGLIRNYQLAVFGRIFGTLFRSGLTIKDALIATAEAMSNVHYRRALLSAVAPLTAGTPLATILTRFPFLFPKNVVAIISVGESSGKLEESLAYIADYFDAEVDLQTKRLPTILEPILLIVIGIVVAFVAIAVISPIYELTSGLSTQI